MALPTGFNPAEGTFGSIAPAPRLNVPRRPTPSYSSSSSSSYSSAYRRRSTPWYRRAWQRYDQVIGNIGNFFADKGKDIADMIVGIAIWGLAIGLVIWVISHWIDDGFLWALLYAVGAVLLFGVGAFCLGIASYILQLLIGLLRLVFWNGWSFLVVTLLFGLNAFWAVAESIDITTPEPTEAAAPMATQTYRVTAVELNVRAQPNTSATVLGVLRHGQEIEVIATDNGFAGFDYNGQLGYASLKYLTPSE